jgi:hypothetical protein
MESRGRRTTRASAPADTMSAAASEPATTPETQQAALSVDQPIADEASETASPINIEERAPEAVSPRPDVVERTSPPLSPRRAAAARSETSADVEQDITAIIAESRAVLARSVESISDEFASFVRQSIDTTAHTAIQMLRVKTWADAVAVNTSYARTSYDHWLDSAVKVSELGLKLALESSKPFVSRIAKVLSRPAD